MMRSMFSAISGLRNHQTYMDVVGNNIANVNTTGYKGSRVTFQDILNQTLRGAAGPQGTRGGVNGAQVGLGTALGSIDVIQTQGNLQATNKTTDLAIQGDGFFVLSDGSRNVYTRAGSFDVDMNGRIVNPASGMTVMGWQADATGLTNTTGPVTSLTIPSGGSMVGQASTVLTIAGNINSATPAAGTAAATVPVYDSLGNRHTLTLTLTKTGSNQWGFAYTVPATDTSMSIASGATGTLTFDNNGKLLTNSATGVPMVMSFTNGAANASIADAGDFSSLTQLQASNDMRTTTDGASAGNLTTFTIGPTGEITGLYSNGRSRPLGQIALASFSNAAGLEKLGNNNYGNSASSGTAQIGLPDIGGRGRVTSGFLEMSNVDLAEQFTNLIMAQRGFQANSRVITTSDELLQDLVNLKR